MLLLGEFAVQFRSEVPTVRVVMDPENGRGHGARTPMFQTTRGLKANLKDAVTRPWRSLARMPKPEVQDLEAAVAGHEGCESWDKF